jgi:uncharacterized membrane protein
MQDVKPWYMSKTIIGAVITVLALVAGVFGYGIGAEDQAALADYAVTIGGVVGGLLAIYGRVKASKDIK